MLFYRHLLFYKILRVPNSDLPEENYSAPHQIKASYVFRTKIFEQRFTVIQTFAFQALRECISLASNIGAMQMFFLTPTKNMFLAVLRECIFYTVEWFEVRKMSEVSWVRLYCKLTDFFASFYWLWDFLPGDLKLVDKFQISSF